LKLLRVNERPDEVDPNATPNISIDSISRRVLNPTTRRDITISGRVAKDSELKSTTATGQRNIIRVIDCVR